MDSMMNMTTPSSSMNMTDSGSGMSMSMPMMMMKTYLHFTPGDTIFFKSIVPTSAGAVFGTCLIFFLISVADRYLRAVCRRTERNFVQRAKQLTTAYYHFNSDAAATTASTDKAPPSVDAPVAVVAAPSRFILSHELTRGGLAGLQSTVHYLLMLVVMTFNAAYIISVILGVVVGEVAFGRLR
ncbi:Ctr copper transporter [Mycena belliarum]|uniref:Copper transport protein n=1 Tax=Mycena belliarum TaxID=1033014 RepID=A0AAD6TMX6_9AGAR|nr:Ctr copper transporter [Mycena belliae]